MDVAFKSIIIVLFVLAVFAFLIAFALSFVNASQATIDGDVEEATEAMTPAICVGAILFVAIVALFFVVFT